jgi:hypothetical protein
MKPSLNKMSLKELKQDLSISAQKGSPMFIAGILFWLTAGLSGTFLSKSITVWIYIFGIGIIFPLGILISKLMKVNFLATHNPLSTIAGLVGGIQIFFAPLVLMVYFNQPDWLPFTVAVLTGAHFLPFVAIYDSKTYLFQTIATVAVATICGFFFLEQSYIFIPYALIIVYFITFIGLRMETKRLSIRMKNGVSA